MTDIYGRVPSDGSKPAKSETLEFRFARHPGVAHDLRMAPSKGPERHDTEAYFRSTADLRDFSFLGDKPRGSGHVQRNEY